MTDVVTPDGAPDQDEEGSGAPRRAPLGVRFERSRVGRIVIGAAVAVVVAIQVFWNLPDSELRREGLDVVENVAEATGLDQNWAVFAPNPRSISLDLYALVEYSDGQTVTWRVPAHGEPFAEPYRTYRWRKWMEHVRADRNQHLWRPAAQWVAQQFTTDERRPARVTLVRRWYDIPAPGSGDPLPDWQEYEFFTYEVPA